MHRASSSPHWSAFAATTLCLLYVLLYSTSLLTIKITTLAFQVQSTAADSWQVATLFVVVVAAHGKTTALPQQNSAKHTFLDQSVHTFRSI